MRNGRTQFSVSSFAVLFVILLTSVSVYASDTRDESIAEFEELLERYPGSEMRAPLLLLLGNLYMEREKDRYLIAAETGGTGESSTHPDYSEAVAVFREVSESGVDGSLEALHALGICYDEMEMRTEASICFRKVAIEAVANEIRRSALLRMGNMYYAASQWEKALNSYLPAIEAEADLSFRKLDYRVGWCHLKLGELAEAEERLLGAARRVMDEGTDRTGEGSLPEILRSLALVRVETDPHGVVEYASLFPDGPSRRIAIAEMGTVLLNHDMPVSAEEAFRLALAIDPNTESAPEIHENIVLSIGAQDLEKESGREMELYAELYAPGGEWWVVNGPDDVRGAQVRSMLWRNLWNAALIRFDTGSKEDIAVAATLFDKCAAGEIAGVEVDRVRLFAAEAWYALGEYPKSAQRFLEIETADLAVEEKRNVLQGTVLSLIETGGGDTGLTDAALRYADHFPGDADAEKTLLLVSSIEEKEGRTTNAILLAERVTGSIDSDIAGEASLSAARLASMEKRWGDAEEWFSTAAGHAKDDTERDRRRERAAASAYLFADAQRSTGLLREAADTFARLFREYRMTETAGDALIGNVTSLACLGEESTLSASADTASRLLQKNKKAACTLREYAADLSRSQPKCAAILYGTAHSIAPETDDLLKAGALYEKAGITDKALACYNEQVSGETGHPAMVRASFRAGILLAEKGLQNLAAEAFEKCGNGAVDPDTNRIEALVRAGSCRIKTGDTERAAECFSLAIQIASESGRLPASEELFLAHAHQRSAELTRPSYRKEILRWRGGEGGRGASESLKEITDHYRASIALGFEETNREAANELASVLELYGRTAFLREWEKGNIPSLDILEPFYREASALYTSLPEKEPCPGFLYSDLADTLILMGIHEIDSSPPPESFDTGDDFDNYSRLVAMRLRSIDSADRKWISARLLTDMQTDDTDPVVTDTGTFHIALSLLAGTAMEEGAELLRNAAPPPGLSDVEETVYRTKLEERAGVMERRAADWFLRLPGSDPVPVTGRVHTEENR